MMISIFQVLSTITTFPCFILTLLSPSDSEAILALSQPTKNARQFHYGPMVYASRESELIFSFFVKAQ
jgi:hypothetical protein